MKTRLAILICGFAALLPIDPVVGQNTPDPWQRMQRFDTNADGNISRAEFQGPDRIFERMDANADGVVTREEAAAVRRPVGTLPAARREPRQPRGGQILLNRVDTDRDERISVGEWTRFFEEADENADQILQPEEWQAAMRQQPLNDSAPQIGDPAPKVKARKRDSLEEVDLSQVRQATVLVFGSYT